MNKEVKLKERKPTWDYMLNDLAFSSLKTRVLYGIFDNQERFDFEYQTELKDKEIERLNGLINTMLEFNLFGEECPLNFGYTERCNEEKAQDVFYEDDCCEKTCNDNYKKCWLKYFKRLQELKEENKK